MKVVYDKRERKLVCKMGTINVCDTVRQLLSDTDEVMMEQVVRTEFDAPWLNETMARELYEWQRTGFQGPPPFWADGASPGPSAN